MLADERRLTRFPHGARGLTCQRCVAAAVLLLVPLLRRTTWLDDVAREGDGVILTGEAIGVEYPLETSIPGVVVAGDVSTGSSKRRAAAVGEGAMAVQFILARLALRAVAAR